MISTHIALARGNVSTSDAFKSSSPLHTVLCSWKRFHERRFGEACSSGGVVAKGPFSYRSIASSELVLALAVSPNCTKCANCRSALHVIVQCCLSLGCHLFSTTMDTPPKRCSPAPQDSDSPPQEMLSTAADVAALKASLGLKTESRAEGHKHVAYVYSVHTVGICIATSVHSQSNLIKKLVQGRKVRRIYTTLPPFDGARGFVSLDTGDTMYCVLNVLLSNWERYTPRTVQDTLKFVSKALMEDFHSAGVKIAVNTSPQATDILLMPNQFKKFADTHGISVDDMDAEDASRAEGSAGFTTTGSALRGGRALYEEGDRVVAAWATKQNKRSLFEAEIEEMSGPMHKVSRID